MVFSKTPSFDGSSFCKLLGLEQILECGSNRKADLTADVGTVVPVHGIYNHVQSLSVAQDAM